MVPEIIFFNTKPLRGRDDHRQIDVLISAGRDAMPAGRPSPAVQEQIQFHDDDLGSRQQPFPAGDLLDPVPDVPGRLA